MREKTLNGTPALLERTDGDMIFIDGPPEKRPQTPEAAMHADRAAPSDRVSTSPGVGDRNDSSFQVCRAKRFDIVPGDFLDR
jgi:hypothetical protein